MYDPLEHQSLVRFASSIVGPDFAEDVVQDYYVKQLSGDIPPYEGRFEATRLTWVLQIVKFTAIHWLMRERRLNPPSWPLLAIDLIEIPEYDAVLDLHRHIEALNDRYRTLLQLLEGDPSFQSIAEKVGLTHWQVKNRIQRARQRLKERLT